MTAFHGDYKMTEPDNTTADMLLAAADIGTRAPGSATSTRATCPGGWDDLEDTCCASCGETLVARHGYHIRRYRVTARRPLPVVR